jgi:hypothetical protein
MTVPPPKQVHAKDDQITTGCPHCGKTFHVPRQSLKKQAKCRCGNVFMVVERIAPPIVAAPPMANVAPAFQAMAAAPAYAAPAMQAYAAPMPAAPAGRPWAIIIFMIVGALMLIAGTLLPWCKIDTLIIGEETWNGLGGGGVYAFKINDFEIWTSPRIAESPCGAILLVCSVAIIVLAGFRGRRWAVLLAAGALACACYVAYAVLEWVANTRKHSQAIGAKDLSPEAGVGIWILVLGGAVAVFAALTAWLVKPQTR